MGAEREDKILNSWTRPDNCQLQTVVFTQTFALPLSSSPWYLLLGSAFSGLEFSPVTLNPLPVLGESNWSHLLLVPWIDPRTGEAWFPMLEPHILPPRRCSWQTYIRITPVCFSAGKTSPLGKNDHWQAPERYSWVSKLDCTSFLWVASYYKRRCQEPADVTGVSRCLWSGWLLTWGMLVPSDESLW